jgi:5-methylcytosine-specific restriction endonuclease McrA
MGICQIRGPHCLGTANTADHIIGWRHGGAWFDKANLRASCQPCNNGRITPVAVDRTTVTAPSRDW